MSREVFEARRLPAYGSVLNHTYVCLHCGHQWARLVLNPARQWVVHTGYCERCPSPWPSDIPGSLAEAVEARTRDGHGCAHLTGEGLVREFQLHARTLGFMD